MNSWKRGLLVALCLILLPVMVWGKVVVTRNGYGIPSIKADKELELFEAFGYTTATDRLWQMEVNKRWGKGTLAEVLGPKLLPADMQTRLMGYTEEEYQTMFTKFPAPSQKLIQAYLKGVNQRVDEVLKDLKLLPLEYQVLKFKPRHFTVSDIFALNTSLVRRFGMVGGGELKNLAALQVLTERFGKGEGWKIFNDWAWINDPSAPTYIEERIHKDFVPGTGMLSGIPSYLKFGKETVALARQSENFSLLANQEALQAGAPVKMGSYSWTLSPKMTGTGYPILMGQPQMGYPVPSIISEVQLKGGRFNTVGMVFPLLPLIPIGYNRDLAWSHMVGMCDNVDVYQEVLNPLNKEEYLFQGAWQKMSKRTERIAVAGGEAKEVVIYRTIHGPVFSPFPFDPKTAKEDRVYTRKLAHWQKEPFSIEGWLRMMRARNAREFGAALSLIMTSLHTTFADTKGNIGYWHTGLNPERPEGFDPRLPLPGTGEAEWTGRYLPNAQVMNPPKGYVTGWNNKSSPDTRNPFGEGGNYHSFGRYNRSLWLDWALKSRTGKLDLAGNKEAMLFVGGAGTVYGEDINAPGGMIKDLLPFMARAIEKAKDEEKPLLNKILAVLSDWDGRSVKDVVKDESFQAGQTFFYDWFRRFLKATFEDEFVGIEPSFDIVTIRQLGILARLLDGSVSTLPLSRNYFDNVKTPTEEKAEDIFLQTLLESTAKLKADFKSDDPANWQAPRSKIVFKHDLFGPVAEMWDNNIGTYAFLVELRPKGAVGYSRWPLGQSGNITLGPNNKPVLNPHFLDMLPLYQGYTYQKMGLE